jgi:prepilin-type N-terminal cleavage/methylation domain-containing protein
MERKHAQLQHRRFGGLGGFSLVELLVAIAISSILAIAFWTLAATQDSTYKAQDSTGEMQQNLRVAVQMLSGSIIGAGLGPQVSTINGQNAGAWYNAANGWVPYRITATSIDIIGCGQVPASLSAQAAAGTNVLALQAGQGANFTVGQDISVEGMESAVVSAVAGDNLTLSAALALTHPLQSNVYLLQWATYSVGGGTLSLDLHNGNGPQAVASDITAMNIVASAVDPKELTVTITGTTATTPTVTTTLTDTVFRRNN